MLKNYWLIAIRKLSRHRVYSLINVLGLTVGTASCLLIYVITHFELSYDTFHPDGDRIYRVIADRKADDGDSRNVGFVVSPLPQTLRNELSGCETVSAFYDYDAKVTIPTKVTIPPKAADRADRHFDKPQSGTPSPIIVAEPQYFDIFKYQWLAGNAATSLDRPFTVVLSQSELQHYFGKITPDEAIGRPVIYNDSLHCTVSGVVRDWNHNTDFGFKDFISFATVKSSFLKPDIDMNAWFAWDYYSQGLIKLPKGTTPAQIERQFPALVGKYLRPGKGESITLHLQPLADIHFNAGYPDGFSRKAHLPTLYGLTGSPSSSCCWQRLISSTSRQPNPSNGPKRSASAKCWVAAEGTSRFSSWARHLSFPLLPPYCPC
jgi:putative ABC transport system permease protein